MQIVWLWIQVKQGEYAGTCDLQNHEKHKEFCCSEGRRNGEGTSGGYAHFLVHYFMKLLAIDPDLAVPQMPINQAIRTAIEKLYFYFLDKEETQKEG